MSLSPANNFNLIDLVSEGRPKTDFQILYDKPVKKTRCLIMRSAQPAVASNYILGTMVGAGGGGDGWWGMV